MTIETRVWVHVGQFYARRIIKSCLWIVTLVSLVNWFGESSLGMRFPLNYGVSDHGYDGSLRHTHDYVSGPLHLDGHGPSNSTHGPDLTSSGEMRNSSSHSLLLTTWKSIAKYAVLPTFGASMMLSELLRPKVQLLMTIGSLFLAKIINGLGFGKFFDTSCVIEPQEQIIRLQAKLEGRRHLLRPIDYQNIRDHLLDMSDHYETDYHNSGEYGGQGIRDRAELDQFHEHVKIINAAIDLPHVNHVLTTEEVEEIKVRLPQILSTYPEEIQNTFYEFTAGIVSGSRRQNDPNLLTKHSSAFSDNHASLTIHTSTIFSTFSSGEPEILVEEPLSRLDEESFGVTSKMCIYLQGPPGVGKTRLARMYAQIMKLPYIEIENLDELSGYPENGRRRYGGGSLGNTRKRNRGGISPDDRFEGCGRLARAMLKYGAKNVIVFIDEFDKLVNKKRVDSNFGNGERRPSSRTDENIRQFLRLLESSEHYLYNDTLEVSMDISNIIFIATGNEPLESEALRTRIQTVSMPLFTPEQRREIFLGFVQEISSMYNDETLESQESHPLSDDDWKVLNEIYNVDLTPGVRTMKEVIRAYFNYREVDRAGLLSERAIARKPFAVTSHIEQRGGTTPALLAKKEMMEKAKKDKIRDENGSEAGGVVVGVDSGDNGDNGGVIPEHMSFDDYDDYDGY